MIKTVKTHRHPLSSDQAHATALWIIKQQTDDGEIPWWRGDKADPWDHVHSAMGLTVAGFHENAAAAYRFLAATQGPEGGWPSRRCKGRVTDCTQETNHAAYIATGLWHFHLARADVGFLTEMWPTLERAIEFVVSLQEPSGAISWALDRNGDPYRAPLLTASASIHGSLVCALRIAEVLGHERPHWSEARERLAEVLRGDLSVFEGTNLPEAPGRYSMDWYYPVLGGAVRGAQGRRLLSDHTMVEKFIAEGVGCRCVCDQPWYTVAETCELVVALDVCGLESRAHQVFSWLRPFRAEDDGYETGKTHPEDVIWPVERNAWTAAAVLVAADALARESTTSGLFRSLAGEDLTGEDLTGDESDSRERRSSLVS